MKIGQISIKNFKGFEEITIPFNPQFNLIIGDNGSGKSAILEALTIAMSSFFLGIKNTDSRHIRESDVRLQTFFNSEEHQLPVVIKANGIVNGQEIEWSRELNSLVSGTLSRGAKTIKQIAEKLDTDIRKGEMIDMPVLAYYSTGRLWRDLNERQSKRDEKKIVASRLRAYKGCLQATSTFKIFLKWYKGKEQSAIQKREEDISLKLIKELIIKNLPNCKSIYYEFDSDKINGLKVELTDGRTLPFEYLSDGTRNMIALLADIAYKCLILNPHLKENSIKMSSGIILIDELDLHLHPDWQKHIIKSLKESFPNIQFISTTHSPFIIQETEEGQLIKLKDNTISVSGANQMSIEDIAEYKQEVENPQWSEKKRELIQVAEEYYAALEKGEVSESQELKLAESILPFSANPAIDAFIQQVKLTKTFSNETNQ